MFDTSMKKRLRKIIVQGYNDRTLSLFKDIVEVTHETFREDNVPTIASFLVSHLFRAFDNGNEELKKYVRGAMISELSRYCNTCPSLLFHPDKKNYSCVSHGVPLERADYPDVYRCSKCTEWE